MIHLTRHAAARYRERVDPAATYSEIAHLVNEGAPRFRVPRWVRGRRQLAEKVAAAIVRRTWRPLADRPGWEYELHVGFPLVPKGDDYVATTCVIRRGQRERLIQGEEVAA